MNKSLVAIAAILVLILFIGGCRFQPQKYMVSEDEQEPVGMANPASEFCVETTGASWSVRRGSGGEYGVCTFSDSSWCEEWAYYRGYCQPGMNITSCEGQFKTKAVCPPDYDPVCAKILIGEEEPYSVRWEDFSNACKACISSTDVVEGYVLGKCE